MDKLSYRPEIDGLRALAVMPVILFHAGFEAFSGGFVGVDIFFVISGYLISRIILVEVAGKTFTFRRFYQRRVRRIIPALLVVLATTLAAASWLALPDQLIDTAKSALAALFSVSNIWFWKQSGYFSSAAEFMPLLHTWSLGIEEQFYILFPVLIVVLARLRLPIGLAIAVIVVLAFALSVWMSFTRPTAAFYLLPARAWELGLGALLASGVLPAIRTPRLRETVALAGLASILFAIFWVDRQMVFPGWVAVLPCVGAAMIIHAAERGGLTHRLLTLRPMVFIGLISYSLYLWHWPIFALTRFYEANISLTVIQGLGGIALTFVLAVLTWRYVEQPFRTKAMPFQRVALVLSGGAAAVVAASVALVITAGLPGRLNDEAQRMLSASKDIDYLVDPCENGRDLSVCRFGPADQPIRYMVVGDSHAAALRPAFDRKITGLEGAGTMWWSGVCPILDGAWLSHGNPGAVCEDFRKRVMAELAASPDISTVILSGRWGYYLTGSMAEDRGSSRNYLLDSETVRTSLEESRRVFERALGRTLDKLTAMGKRVIIVGGVPEPGFDVSHIFALAALNGRPGPRRTVDAAAEASKEAELSEIFEAAARQRPNVSYVEIMDTFCSEKECRLLDDGTPVYHDDDHISRRAATELVGARLQRRIEDSLQSANGG